MRARSARVRIHLAGEEPDEHGRSLRVPDEDDRPPVVVVGEIVLPARRARWRRRRHRPPVRRRAPGRARPRCVACTSAPRPGTPTRTARPARWRRPTSPAWILRLALADGCCADGRVHVEAVELRRGHARTALDGPRAGGRHHRRLLREVAGVVRPARDGRATRSRLRPADPTARSRSARPRRLAPAGLGGQDGWASDGRRGEGNGGPASETSER